MDRRFRRNCGLYFFCFRDMVPESKDGWGSICSALHLRKVCQRSWTDQQSNWQVLCQHRSRDGDSKWNMSNVLRGMWKRQQRSKWKSIGRAKTRFRMGRRQHWARWTLLTSATLGLVSLPALCLSEISGNIFSILFFKAVLKIFSCQKSQLQLRNGLTKKKLLFFWICPNYLGVAIPCFHKAFATF